ncbi:MAG: hypothetical protein HYV90_04470 [Candidatus Woesebacteria bacterium]|nr:MAG: hypothetical protein HYV90_04470 [Candidatus Woesebacteria bacterium]
MFKNIPTGTKQILVAVLPLLAVSILIVVVGKFGLSKISEVRTALTKAQADKVLLTQKFNILRTVLVSVGDAADVSLMALPQTNPALAVASQIKLVASENSVLISGVKSGSEVADKTGLSRSDISFNISGSRTGVLAFIKGIQNIAPLIVVDKIKISENNGVVDSSISIKSFWSPLPTKLPSITTQVADLSAAEKQLITDMGSLRKPVFVVVPPSTGAGKTDPFSP